MGRSGAEIPGEAPAATDRPGPLRQAEGSAYVRAYPTELPLLGDLLASIETPVEIINGLKEPVVPVVNAEYLHERLPNSKLDIIDGGHFIWEEAADDYAKAVTDRWQAH